MRNNFKELEREQEFEFAHKTEKINRSLKSNLGVLGFVGDMIELYLSRILGFFVSVSGGSPSSHDLGRSNGRPKYPNTH